MNYGMNTVLSLTLGLQESSQNDNSVVAERVPHLVALSNASYIELLSSEDIIPLP